MSLYQELKKIQTKPGIFSAYTSEKLWDDEHISKQMLEAHLNPDTDTASRNHQFINQSVQWMISRFDIQEGSRICDLGCGPGLYTTRFAEHGAEVTGIDLSKNSLTYARATAKKKNLQIEYIQGNYLEFSTDKKFDLITMIYRDFSALNPNQRSRLLEKCRTFLVDDGCLFFDVDSTVLFNNQSEKSDCAYQPEGGFWSSESHHIFHSIFTYPDEKVILHKYTVVQETRNWEVLVWMQCFTKESITTELKCNGFLIEDWYSNTAGKPFDPSAQEFALAVKKLET
ncbi:MAG: class I SAM-dependent methyltransferase [Spirochaetia bacterium]